MLASCSAFSRSGAAKVYVQDRMREHGGELARWLLEGSAILYVCGDGARMAKDVRAAVCAVLNEHGGVMLGGQAWV